ncbi:hypothetical protein [Plantactinospora sp. DSM 117369]
MPVLTGALPDLTAGVPVLAGAFPELAAGVPVLTGARPDLLAGVPLVRGALPDVLGVVPEVVVRLPELAGTVPEIVGSVPEVVGEVPRGGYSGGPSPLLLVHQPVEPSTGSAVAPPALPPALVAAVAVPAEPPRLSAPPRHSLDPGAGGAAGASRPSASRAVARSTNSGLPSTPRSPVGTDTGTQQAGPTPSSGGQTAALPAAAGSPSPTRTPSLFPYGDASPTGRSPGVPALPG